jgi:hypothetical protein
MIIIRRHRAMHGIVCNSVAILIYFVLHLISISLDGGGDSSAEEPLV